jgi:hypothetical protein
VVASWRRAWSHVIPFFAFPPQVRRVIYTTNAIESVNARLRKIIKTRGHFPSDEAATKLIWLALRNITAEWGRAAHNWKEAMNQFAILYVVPAHFALPRRCGRCVRLDFGDHPTDPDLVIDADQPKVQILVRADDTPLPGLKNPADALRVLVFGQLRLKG